MPRPWTPATAQAGLGRQGASLGDLHLNRGTCSAGLVHRLHRGQSLGHRIGPQWPKKSAFDRRVWEDSPCITPPSAKRRGVHHVHRAHNVPWPLPSRPSAQTRGSRTGPGATTERPWSDSEKSDSPLLKRRKPLPANHLRRLTSRIAREQERFWKHFYHIVGTGVRWRGLAGCHRQRLPLRVPPAKGPKAGHEPCRKQFLLRKAGA